MAVTHMSLLLLAAFAALLSSSLVLRVPREVKVAAPFLASLTWGLLGIASFDVSAQAFSEPQPVMPLVFLGIVFAVGTGAMTLYHLSKLLGEETGATDAGGLLPDQGRRR